MNQQIDKDIMYYQRGMATPHWHFEHDPRIAPEMLPLLNRLETAGIRWTWGRTAPNTSLLTPIR
jgi:hypothetical protein